MGPGVDHLAVVPKVIGELVGDGWLTVESFGGLAEPEPAFVEAEPERDEV